MAVIRRLVVVVVVVVALFASAPAAAEVKLAADRIELTLSGLWRMEDAATARSDDGLVSIGGVVIRRGQTAAQAHAADVAARKKDKPLVSEGQLSNDRSRSGARFVKQDLVAGEQEHEQWYTIEVGEGRIQRVVVQARSGAALARLIPRVTQAIVDLNPVAPPPPNPPRVPFEVVEAIAVPAFRPHTVLELQREKDGTVWSRNVMPAPALLRRANEAAKGVMPGEPAAIEAAVAADGTLFALMYTTPADFTVISVTSQGAASVVGPVAGLQGRTSPPQKRNIRRLLVNDAGSTVWVLIADDIDVRFVALTRADGAWTSKPVSQPAAWARVHAEGFRAHPSGDLLAFVPGKPKHSLWRIPATGAAKKVADSPSSGRGGVAVLADGDVWVSMGGLTECTSWVRIRDGRDIATDDVLDAAFRVSRIPSDSPPQLCPLGVDRKTGGLLAYDPRVNMVYVIKVSDTR